MAAVLIPNPNHSPAAPKPPRTPHEPGTPGGAPAPLLRRLRAEQPAAGQRRRRLEGLRRQRDRRSREARTPRLWLPAARRRQQDGIDDLLLAAAGPGNSGPAAIGQRATSSSAGRAGSPPSSISIRSTGRRATSIDGSQLGDGTGFGGGGAGDINHDGIPDLVIGANGQTPSGDRLTGGQTFVLYGGAAHLAALDLADGTQDGRIDLSATRRHPRVRRSTGSGAGATEAAWSPGHGAGDVNGDHVDDLVIGDDYGGAVTPGKVYVVFGRDSTAGQRLPRGLRTLVAGRLQRVRDPGPRPRRTASASRVGGGGDVNGDGIGDLVLGAMYRDPVRPHQRRPGLRDLRPDELPRHASTSPRSTAATASRSTARAANDYLGGYTADVAGDVNGDGIDDVLIGGLGRRWLRSRSVGAAYVVFGKTTRPSRPSSRSPRSTARTASRCTASRASDYVGVASQRAGDVNGDGYDDILIGARDCRPERHHRRRPELRRLRPAELRGQPRPRQPAGRQRRRRVGRLRPQRVPRVGQRGHVAGDRRHQRRRLRRHPRRGRVRRLERPDRHRPGLHRLRQAVPGAGHQVLRGQRRLAPTAPTSTPPPAAPSRTTP